MRRLVGILAALALLLAACGSDDAGTETSDAGNGADDTAGSDESSGEDAGDAAPSGETVEVTILGTIKGEIGTQFESAMAAYNDSQDAYEIVSVPMDGSNPVEKMTTLYASGNATTMMVMGQEFSQFQENLLDLSDAEFTSHALEGTQDFVTVDGAIYGMPVTVEAFGILYNQAVVDGAVDGGFDGTGVATRSDLVEVLDAVEANGVAPFHLSPMDWSLGAHLTNLMFAPQDETPEGRRAFLDQLKAGEMSLLDNDVFNGWVDTVDLLVERNVNAGSPLAADYDDGTLELATGDTGMWFMGNWALPQLMELGGSDAYGIMPLPISDDESTYGNTQLSVGVPSYIVIDASQSTPEEQEGAIDFLNWLVTDPVGQDFYVNEFNFIPVYDTFELRPQDPMSNQILEYLEAGETLEWVNSLYPPDGWPTMGATMQEYITGRIDRAGLAAAFEEYWSGVDS